MNDKEISLLRKVYSDIIQGYSNTLYRDQKVSIKHFTSFDHGLIDENYDIYYNEAISQGLPNEEQRLKDSIEQGLWSTKDEAWIVSHKSYITNLHATKSKISWQSQVEEMNKNISDAEIELENKLKEKKEVLGLVAETYASKKLNQCYIFQAFRKSNSIKESLFNEEDFADLSMAELNELTGIYNKTLLPFQTKNLKKIGLAGFFQSLYSICDNNPFVFYGKSICELTFYQSEIFTYGRFFKSILSGGPKFDEETLADPDKLIDQYMAGQNAQQFVGDVDNDTNGATMIFGAKKSDIRAAGGTIAKSPVAKAIKDGKSMNIEEVIKHQRV